MSLYLILFKVSIFENVQGFSVFVAGQGVSIFVTVQGISSSL